MSLDVYLEAPAAVAPLKHAGIFIRVDGAMHEISREEWDERCPDRDPVFSVVTENSAPQEVYWRNITHNLGRMADAAGIYKALWRPDENGIETAAQLIDPLTDGLMRLRYEPNNFKAYNPENGWGDYDGLVSFVADYLEACRTYPTATVRVSR